MLFLALNAATGNSSGICTPGKKATTIGVAKPAERLSLMLRAAPEPSGKSPLRPNFPAIRAASR